MGLFSGTLYAKSPPTRSNSSAYVFRSLSFGRVLARTYSFCIRVMRFARCCWCAIGSVASSGIKHRVGVGSPPSPISVSTSEREGDPVREEMADGGGD